MKIAILGATGHIAKNLINAFSRDSNKELYLFARNIPKLQDFIQKNDIPDDPDSVTVRLFDEFGEENFDAIINCVGKGNPKEILEMGPEILFLTEIFDKLCIGYIKKYPETMYINCSSGGVYGLDFEAPATNETITNIDVNHILREDFYRVAKLNAEVKHRGYPNYNIVDLRIFAFFSRFQELTTTFITSNIINAIKEKREFITNSNEIMRDYVHPLDLICLVDLCIKQKKLNDALDLYSLNPCSKSELLDYFVKNYGLKVIVDNEKNFNSITGKKSMYYSINKKAASLGYIPKFSSIQTIVEESKYLL